MVSRAGLFVLLAVCLALAGCPEDGDSGYAEVEEPEEIEELAGETTSAATPASSEAKARPLGLPLV